MNQKTNNNNNNNEKSGHKKNNTKEPFIKIRGLCKSFGTKVVLKDLDLDIHKDESVVILGGSGTGKSVLIKCILGLLEPDAGAIIVDGVNLCRASDKEKEEKYESMNMLFQGSALFDSLTVWENIAFKALQVGMPKDEAMDLARKVAKSVGLREDVLELSPSELSGGMQKRVSLARAVAITPDIIFFDEPTTGLDPIISNVINELISNIVKKIGATAITITHDLNSAKKIADRVAMLYEGKIIWIDKVAKLEKSGNDIVDQFVHGRINGPIKVDVA